MIDFPNLRVFGGIALTQGKDRFYISARGLDFSFELSSLGGINVPLVSNVLALLSPLSKPFKIKLRGTPQTPDWDLNPGVPFSSSK